MPDQKKTVFITGGSTGIGAASVRKFAASGWNVAFMDINVEDGQAVAQETGALFVEGNTRNREDLDKAVAAAIGTGRNVRRWRRSPCNMPRRPSLPRTIRGMRIRSRYSTRWLRGWSRVHVICGLRTAPRPSGRRRCLPGRAILCCWPARVMKPARSWATNDAISTTAKRSLNNFQSIVELDSPPPVAQGFVRSESHIPE